MDSSNEEVSDPAPNSTNSQIVDVHDGNFSHVSFGDQVKEIAQDSYEGPVQNVIRGADLSGATLGDKTTTNYVYNYSQGSEELHRFADAKDTFEIRPRIVVHENDPINAESRILRAILQSDVTGNQEIAIKILSNNESSKKEAAVHFSLPSHPNIVHPIFSNTFKYHGQTCLYIALELCDQLNLYKFVKKLKSEQCPFPANLFISYVKQITEGVAFLHRHRIINRDLKPQNILLNTEKTVPKICDFGLSKPIVGDVTEQSKLYAGTSGWMSPEVLWGIKLISTSADIFSLGLIDYFLLSYGEHAFGNDPTSRDYFIKIDFNRSLNNLQILNPDPVREIINQMLNPNPILRPTVEQVKTEDTELFSNPDNAERNIEVLHSPKPRVNVEKDAINELASLVIETGNVDSKEVNLTKESKPQQIKISDETAKEQFSPELNAPKDSNKLRTLWGSIRKSLKKREKQIQVKPREEISSLSTTIHPESAQTKSSDMPENIKGLQQITKELEDHSKILDEAEDLIKDSKFDEAIDKIQRLRTTQQCELMMAECYLQIGKKEKASECISTLDQLIAHQSCIYDVDRLADEYISAELFIRALVLLSCLSKLYKSESDPNQAVEEIRCCSHKCAMEVIIEMIHRGGQLRVIATDFGLEMINDMLTQLRSVSGADSDLKSLNETMCLNDISSCHDELKNYQKSIELLQQGVDSMRKQFGENSSRHIMFGALLNDIGIAHKFLGKYCDAREFYLQALEVYDVVEDWQNDDVKHEIITKTKNNILHVENLMYENSSSIL